MFCPRTFVDENEQEMTYGYDVDHFKCCMYKDAGIKIGIEMNLTFCLHNIERPEFVSIGLTRANA